MEKSCIECGDPVRGRSDKKFCNDVCRNSYNNRTNCEANNFVRNVNNVLRRNRKILEAFIKGAKVSIEKYQLIKMGFDFRYFTHSQLQYNDEPVYYCYEFGYRDLDNEFVSIVRDEPMVNYRARRKKDSDDLK